MMNKTHKITVLRLAVTLILSCAAFYYAASGHLPSARKSTVPEEGLQRIAELSSDKYNDLLQAWSKDPNYPSDTDANFPDFYSCAYVDDNKELVILVTTLDDETVQYFETLIDLEHVCFSAAEHSFQELLHAQEAVDHCVASGTLDENVSALITGTGISAKENAVIVYAATENPEELCGSFTDVFSANNSQACNIQFHSLYGHWPAQRTIPEPLVIPAEL